MGERLRTYESHVARSPCAHSHARSGALAPEAIGQSQVRTLKWESERGAGETSRVSELVNKLSERNSGIVHGANLG